MMRTVLYKIEIATAGFPFKLLVNDVPVVKHNKTSGFSSSFSINEWLIDGANTLRVEIPTDYSNRLSSAYVNLNLGTCNLEHQNFKSFFKWEKIDFVTKPIFVFVHPFVVKDLPEVIDYTSLPIIDFTKKEVLQKFYKINYQFYQLFKEKKLDDIIKLCAFKFDAYEKLNFIEKKVETNNYSSILKKVFSEEFLLKYVPEQLNYHLHCKGRLATLEYDQFGLPAINSTDSDFKTTRSFIFYWALNAQNEFFIYR